jgi:competence protein ComEC
MPTKRAPLFSVSLAFATGCVVGLDEWVGLRVALLLFVLAAVVWLAVRRHERLSLLAFYLLVACAGLSHTLLMARTISPDDLRRLPDDKALATTQWRGIIADEPASPYPAHASRRALDRTSFVLHVAAWRVASGRLFGDEVDTPWEAARGDLSVTVLGPASELRCGDEIEFSAPIEPVAPALVPGEFDSRDMEARQGIYYEAYVRPTDWRRLSTGGSDGLTRLSYAARDWAYDRLQIGLEDDPRTADFLAGMLIGYRQEIPQDIEQDFRRTGTIHVFAVSGQNIGEMFVVALVLLQLLGLVRWRWAWLLAPLVLLYCLLTGFPASAVRATIMALGVLAAWKLERPLNALACWSLAFLAMLVWNPGVLVDPGAQLSFALVLALILVAPPIYRRCIVPFSPDPFLPRSLLTRPQRWEWRMWETIIALLCTGVAAVLVCEPITAVDFHQITPISILANLVVVPMAGLITSVGTMSVAISLVCTPLAALLNNANWLFARVLILFVGFMAHEPGAMINVPDVAALASPPPSFVVAPLRDSACLLVRTERGASLINTGREYAGPAPVWHFLQFYGINRLDRLVLAQMSGPDNSGAAAIVRDFSPGELVVPVLRTKSPLEKELAEIVAASGRLPVTWSDGQVIPLAPDLTVEVLHPAADSPETHADDRGLVLLFHAAGQTLLWAGRIGSATQAALRAAHPTLHADVLVMCADAAPDEAWLEALGVREWLQIPPREARVNVVDAPAVPAFCRVWKLDETGAVDLRFLAAQGSQPERIVLRPWAAAPSANR